MPQYMKLPVHFTQAANSSLWGYSMSWENTGVGPNQGPIFLGADPVSQQGAETDFVVYDFAKCRRAPGPSGGTEVFYQFGIRNLSQFDAVFDLELIDFKDLMPSG